MDPDDRCCDLFNLSDITALSCFCFSLSDNWSEKYHNTRKLSSNWLFKGAVHALWSWVVWRAAWEQLGSCADFKLCVLFWMFCPLEHWTACPTLHSDLAHVYLYMQHTWSKQLLGSEVSGSTFSGISSHKTLWPAPTDAEWGRHRGTDSQWTNTCFL